MVINTVKEEGGRTTGFLTKDFLVRRKTAKRDKFTEKMKTVNISYRHDFIFVFFCINQDRQHRITERRLRRDRGQAYIENLLAGIYVLF